MKLYTENEVRSLLNDLMLLESSVDDAIDSLTPIELPSDEEIGYYADYAFPYAEKLGGQTYAAHKALKIGAKWVIEKIKQQVIP